MFNQHNKHDIISCENIIPEIANNKKYEFVNIYNIND